MEERKKGRRNDGFTKGQRQWLIDRDKKCVLCGSYDRLEAHHLVPFRYALNVLRWTLERTNSPVNGVMLCMICHRGDDNSIHPDIARASKLYQQDKQIYAKLFAKRDELCRSGMVYWSQKFDNILSEIAVRNTLCYVQGGANISVWTDGKEYGIPKFPLVEEDDEDYLPGDTVQKIVEENLKPEKKKFITPVIVKKEAPQVESMSQFMARNKGG